MAWYRKEDATPFDAYAMAGLHFRDGNVLARQHGVLWLEGMKSPAIAFPSGWSGSLWEAHPGEDGIMVHLFAGMDLPLNATFAEAHQAALDQASEGYASVFTTPEHELELWHHEAKRSILWPMTNRQTE